MTTVSPRASAFASAQESRPQECTAPQGDRVAEARPERGRTSGPAPTPGPDLAEHMKARARALPPEQLLAMYEQGLTTRGVSALARDTLRAVLLERLTAAAPAPAGATR
jgi:hypothetical protein